MRYLLLALLIVCHPLFAAARQVDEFRWSGVGRIVAIGDLHGDYDGYLAVLQSAGLVNTRGRWIGGDTHLVQTGDIPDRGPDTRRIIGHMAQLAREARRHGGRVHNLLGNHEAMNVYGDLRYTTAGEYRAFAGRGSAALRDSYFAAMMEALAASDPERHAVLPEDYRERWDREHPLGWVEHRLAWDPRLDDKGELFQWAMQAKVAIQINELLFVHGGLSGAYCGNSLRSLTTKAHEALRRSDPNQLGILEDERGPLWYRGLAGIAPATPTAIVDAILETHHARHIVIGHTPTQGIVWPRLDGRVIMIDTGIGAAYGGHIGWLEVTNEGLFAGYRGGRLSLPMLDAQRSAYLDKVIGLDPGNAALMQRRVAVGTGQDVATQGESEDASAQRPAAAVAIAKPATPPPASATTCDTAR
ncbi:MAG: metallophosphoesterase [Pseudomonadota bacterium]